MSISAKQRQVSMALFLIRMSISLVLYMWTLDKFYRPAHAAAIFEHFYGLAGLGTLGVFLFAIAETILLIIFMLGLFPKYTYGLVLLLHGVSTLSSYHQYLHPFESNNLLFFAAWPMLAACFALYSLRDLDTWRVNLRK